MSRSLFQKFKTSYVLKSDANSVEFDSYQKAMKYYRRFSSLFPDYKEKIRMFKVVVFENSNLIENE